MIGTILDHGPAPYQFDTKRKINYYIKLSTSYGEKTMWSLGLNDALMKSGCQIGDFVVVKHEGKKPVQIPTETFVNGQKVLTYVSAYRSAFSIEKTEIERANKKHLKNDNSSSLNVKQSPETHLDVTPSLEHLAAVNSLNNVFFGMMLGFIGLAILNMLFF